jgi:hypothetical protein
MEIRLGAKYRDRITNFEGIAVSLTQYITGPDVIGLTSATQDPDGVQDGKFSGVVHFDLPRVEMISSSPIVPLGDDHAKTIARSNGETLRSTA